MRTLTAIFVLMAGTVTGLAAGLVEPDEGDAIVEAAWRHRRLSTIKPDCSHLVHQVYALAGYRYDYAPSDTLYRGTEEFRRVSRPQPGDLIVWRGHVGIVVDPEERTFYSSQRTGLKTAEWDSSYWKRRGRARFYRYRESDRRVEPAYARARPEGPEVSSKDSSANRREAVKKNSKATRAVRGVIATGLPIAVRAIRAR